MNTITKKVLSCCLVLSLSIFALIGCGEQAQIVGEVVDESGNPLKNVDISVKGTKFSGKTDEQGKYAVEYIPGKIILLFSKPNHISTQLDFDISKKSLFNAQKVILYKDVTGEYRGEFQDMIVNIFLNQNIKNLSGMLLFIEKRAPINKVMLEINNGMVDKSNIIFNASGQMGFVKLLFRGRLEGEYLVGNVTIMGSMGSREAIMKLKKVEPQASNRAPKLEGKTSTSDYAFPDPHPNLPTSRVLYSSDRQYVALLKLDTGEVPVLDVVCLRDKKPLSNPPSAPFGFRAGINGISWHPTKNLLIYAADLGYSTNPGIYVWDVERNKVIRIVSPKKGTPFDGQIEFSRLSNDGNTIFFFIHRYTRNGHLKGKDLYQINVNGKFLKKAGQ
jgi:hypothetical protein